MTEDTSRPKKEEKDERKIEPLTEQVTADTNNKKSQAEAEEKSTKKKPKKSAKEKTAEEIKDLEKKLEELNDKYVRLSAEFDNYRKRTLKEKMELTKFGGEKILVNMLPVIDNFERALESINEAKNIKAVKEGVQLIYNNFKDFVSQNGIKEIEALNMEFDTDKHEAITKIKAPREDLKGKVVDCVEKGYFLHDKVIRFSKVVVGE